LWLGKKTRFVREENAIGGFTKIGHQQKKYPRKKKGGKEGDSSPPQAVAKQSKDRGLEDLQQVIRVKRKSGRWVKEGKRGKGRNLLVF